MTQQTTQKRSRSLSLRLRLPLLVLVVMLVVGAVLALAAQFMPGLSLVIGQQFVLIMAVTAITAVIAVFFATVFMTRRLNRVRNTLEDLSSGQRTNRTRMHPSDEVGQLGQAVDQYADYVQGKQDELRELLRSKRTELERMFAVLESIPDGVIVQDLDGRVILMNEQARALLGSQRMFRSAGFHELTALVTDTLGAALAPGVYAMGTPQRVALGERMLSAQAAAVLSPSNDRLGTVILLRDITPEVRQARERDALIQRMEKEVYAPISSMVQRKHRSGLFTDLMMEDFVKALMRHTVALHMLISEMREVSAGEEMPIKREHRPMLLETLIWAVANEWRQVATANGVTMHIHIGVKGLHILCDETRMRWALGNVVDNAIKYTPAGGSVTLEIVSDEPERAVLRVRDTGVGISPEDLSHIFSRFYRGTPTTSDGRVIRQPGMGQGLYIARQIIEAHGGSIRLKSKIHSGTAVYIVLPLTWPEGWNLNEVGEDVDGETVPIKPEKDATESKR